MRMLEGVEEKGVRGGGRREGGKEEEINLEKIRSVIRNLKDGKAVRMNGITVEVWKYGARDMEIWAWDFCNKLWRREG